MKIRLLIIIIASLALGGCSLVPKKSGLEIMSYPPAKVYINNKEAGMTPYKNNNLQPGKVDISLKTETNQWSKVIELQNNINTVINWEFGKEEKDSGGYILYLEKTGDGKKAGLMVNAIPDKAAIAVDNEIKGFSPQRFNDISEGDRQLTLSFPGRKNLNVFMKAINGYQLVIEANLAEDLETIEPVVEVKPSPTIGQQIKQVTIKETETGWLRVRSEPSSSGSEVGLVNPGEKYPLLEESTDWYKIDLGNNKSGWVSAKYASKVE
jgi:uncharacterized protein YgiM (DUF1202 family)